MKRCSYNIHRRRNALKTIVTIHSVRTIHHVRIVTLREIIQRGTKKPHSQTHKTGRDKKLALTLEHTLEEIERMKQSTLHA